jgi:hypothetical protein
MKDTPPEIELECRRLLLARSREERLKMGCSMHATARSLVRASVLAKDPMTPPAVLRFALFLRFYGHEFGPEDRERITAWLGSESTETAQAPRRAPVN